jgi:hypothetical protein
VEKNVLDLFGAEELRLSRWLAGGGTRCSNQRMAETLNSTDRQFMTMSLKMASTERIRQAHVSARPTTITGVGDMCRRGNATQQGASYRGLGGNEPTRGPKGDAKGRPPENHARPY